MHGARTVSREGSWGTTTSGARTTYLGLLGVSMNGAAHHVGNQVSRLQSIGLLDGLARYPDID